MFLGEGGSALSSRPFAEQTQTAIDTEVARMLREAEQRAVGVLEEHRDVLDALVQLLLNYETVDGSEVYALAHRPEPVGGEGLTVARDRAAGTVSPGVGRSLSGSGHEANTGGSPIREGGH